MSLFKYSFTPELRKLDGCWCYSVTLGKTWSPGEPQHYDRGQWSGLAVVLSVNLFGASLHTMCGMAPIELVLGLLVVAFRRDIVWCVAATWICASIWSLSPKPYPVFVSML